MKRKLTLMLAFLFVWMGIAWSQGLTVKGVVTSEEDGLPIVGASVLVKGTTQGTITDVDGNFMITGVKAESKTLIVSFVGMKSQEVAIKNTPLHVILKSDSEVLDEVVVTALGMKRSEKTLGYAATTVKSEDIDAGKSGSVMGGLSGKVAGVQISSAGNTGTSQKVLIRGISSLNNNSPLYIVDGVPIDNSTFRGSPTDDSSTTDFGNAANDINSEDVESVTILKGASATALYGSRAANGVVMITTKKAGIEKLSVTYDGSFTASKVLRVMQTQDLFGQGWGSWNRSENGSWGPRLDGTIHEWGSDQLETPMTKPFSYVEHNLRNFYQTGFEKNNNVSVRYGNDKVGVVASYGNLSSNGILPNNGDLFSRNTFSLRGYMNINKFSLDMTMNYVRKDISRSNDMYMELLQHAVDVDFSQMKDYNDERYNLDNYYTFYATNPYYMIDNYRSNYQDDRVYGRIEMSYEIMKGLKATARLGGDFSNNRTTSQEPKTTFSNGSYSQLGGATESLGYYSEYRYNRSQIDATALLNADYKIHDFSINAVAGWNLNQRSYGYTGGYVDGLAIAGWYSLYNTSSSAVSVTYNELRRLIGAFAQAELGYKDMVFLNLSGRNDWSSTLAKENRSFFYPSVSLSWVFSDMMNKFNKPLPEWITYAKARASFAQVGNDMDPYQLYDSYTIGSDQWGNTTAKPGDTKYDATVRSELISSWEAGLEMKFFNNRLGFDFAWYKSNAKRQLMKIPVNEMSGYKNRIINAGNIQNTGVELMINARPVETATFSWDTQINFSKNNNKILDLGPGIPKYELGGAEELKVYAVAGGNYGEIWGTKFARVTDQNSPYYGKLILNDAGLPTTDGERYKIGDQQPDCMIGWNNTFSYKNFAFTFQFDGRIGGDIYSYTNYMLQTSGRAAVTAPGGNREEFVLDGVIPDGNGGYKVNTVSITQEAYWKNGIGTGNQGIAEANIYDGTNFRLRNVALNYTFPREMLKRTCFQQVKLGVSVNNVWMIYSDMNGIDPESVMVSNTNATGFEFGASPTSRTYLFNVTLGF